MEWIIKISVKRSKKPKAHHLVFFDSQGVQMDVFVLNEGETLTVVAAGAKKDGTPAGIDPTFEDTWVGDLAGLAAISPVAGTPSCNFTFLGAGTVTITTTADADLTTAVKPITGQFQILCVAKPPELADHLTFTATSAPTP